MTARRAAGGRGGGSRAQGQGQMMQGRGQMGMGRGRGSGRMVQQVGFAFYYPLYFNSTFVNHYAA